MAEEAKTIIFNIYKKDLLDHIRYIKVFLVDFDKWLNKEKAFGITYFSEFTHCFCSYTLLLPIVFISLKVLPEQRLTTIIHEFIHVSCEIQNVKKYLEHGKEFKMIADDISAKNPQLVYPIYTAAHTP